MDSNGKAKHYPTFDAFNQACPSHTVLEVLANKWAHLVICSLRAETLRFGELQRRIGGVTPKMLTQTLRTLERDGLLRRRIYAVIPPKVEYELTALGQDLTALLDAILRWSERHVPEILRAREVYQEQGSGQMEGAAPRRTSPDAALPMSGDNPINRRIPVR